MIYALAPDWEKKMLFVAIHLSHQSSLLGIAHTHTLSLHTVRILFTAKAWVPAVGPVYRPPDGVTHTIL